MVAYERARDWLAGSDPGLLRLQMAVRTTLTLAVALGLLDLLTMAVGQPLTAVPARVATSRPRLRRRRADDRP